MMLFAKLFDFSDQSQVLVTIKNELNNKALEIRTDKESVSYVKKIKYRTTEEVIECFENYGISDAIKFKMSAYQKHKLKNK